LQFFHRAGILALAPPDGHSLGATSGRCGYGHKRHDLSVPEPSERDLRTVGEDLEFLDREFREDIDDQTIRRNSNVLWMLLIDGWYGRAWRAAGNRGQPSVDATDPTVTTPALPPRLLTMEVL
jgi:hypothetical protein